jgi:NADH dehydrogenase FAD-containing subunit
MRLGRAFVLLAIALILGACDPQDRRPGLWLTGEVADVAPGDWSFSDEHGEIALEVATPYLIPHSVTIWCAQVDGTLYVAAAAPEEKNWPGWVADDPDVRLKIGDTVYVATLAELEDAAEIQAVRGAYAGKYEVANLGSGASLRYWRVGPRGG